VAGTDDNPIVYPELEMPKNVRRQKITIWSRGVALDGDIYGPDDLADDEKVPAVVLSHGIGGDKNTTGRYAAKFAEARMMALTFTHASWGDSRGQLLASERQANVESGQVFEARVTEVRDLLDPLDWVDSFRACIDYIVGEPQVDVDRIGAWGTSYGGGTALYATAIDNRVKALSIQVPAVFNLPASLSELACQRATQIARGEFDAVRQSEDRLPRLVGTPHLARMAQYHVGDKVRDVTVPTLILDAANEEMFNIAESGGRAHKILTDRGVDTYYEVLPDIDHYGIYFGGFNRGNALALEWFQKHL